MKAERQATVDHEQLAAARSPLPRMRPVAGSWIKVDEAYCGQIAERRRLLDDQPSDVLAPIHETPVAEALHRALRAAFHSHGSFDVSGETVSCPDGREGPLRIGTVLQDAAALCQEDLCVLQRGDAGYVLIAALLCFPASWTLREKLGRPLSAIHQPVDAYDAQIARRVDRLFDGVREGQPLWRANALAYEDPALFQPRPEADPRPVGGPTSRFLRSERQTILRLSPDLVLFAIHTSVVDRGTERPDPGTLAD